MAPVQVGSSPIDRPKAEWPSGKAMSCNLITRRFDSDLGLHAAGSSRGRTPVSEAGYVGSNPAPAANSKGSLMTPKSTVSRGPREAGCTPVTAETIATRAHVVRPIRC